MVREFKPLKQGGGSAHEKPKDPKENTPRETFLNSLKKGEIGIPELTAARDEGIVGEEEYKTLFNSIMGDLWWRR